MIDADEIKGIIATYERHGWILRRVLLSERLKDRLGAAQFGGVPVVDSKIDAAWFSRPPKPGGVAWEIRYFGGTPFALLEHIDEDDPEFETALHSVESRLRESIRR